MPLIFLSIGAAAAETNLTPQARLCAFRKPLEVGASVTGRVGEVIPYSAITRAVFGIKSAPYQGSPGSIFIDHYRKLDLQFAGPAYKHGKYAPENLGAFITNKRSDTGSGQIENLLEGENKAAFESATMIIGIDLFYWDAIRETCGYGSPSFSGRLRGNFDKEVRRSDVEFHIERLIAKAKEEGKTLILGNLPYENSSQVLVNKPGFWYPQSYACVTSINNTISDLCKIKNGCYVLDLKGLAADLGSGKRLFVKSLGKGIDLYEARPDGVHLSEAGAAAVAEKMMDLIEHNPPACGAYPTQDSAKPEIDAITSSGTAL